MSHIDPDDLALFAVSPAAATDAQRAHLDDCAACAAEERALVRTVELGRTVDDVELMTPPSAVWARIHAELGLSDAVATAPAPAPAPASAEAEAVSPLPTEAAVVPIGVRARRRLWPLLAAAAVVGVIGGIAAGVLLARPPQSFSVIAEAALDPLPGQDATGNARVEERADGGRDVVVTLDGDAAGATPNDASLREVWLLTPDASGLVSLGFLDGATGRFVIPNSIDLAQYPLVDVSVEALDGDPAHSGNSVVRGQLRAS